MSSSTRKGTIEQARALIAIAGNLRNDGDTIDPSTVARVMGISLEEAGDLLALLVSAGGEEHGGLLPLSLEDDGSVTLRTPLRRSMSGKCLRLTKDEADALTAAFEAMGLSEGSELRSSIILALYPECPNEADMHRSLSAQDESLSQKLDALAQAILNHIAIAFDYEPVSTKPLTGTCATGFALRKRHVCPLALRHESDLWYLDAHDLDRDAMRVFRIDRMSMPVTTDRPWPEIRSTATTQSTRMVNLTFLDRLPLDLFEWPGLVICGRGAGRVNCQIPWYLQSTWLPRHLAACGGMVKIYDQDLERAVRAYAADLSSHGEKDDRP